MRHGHWNVHSRQQARGYSCRCVRKHFFCPHDPPTQRCQRALHGRTCHWLRSCLRHGRSFCGYRIFRRPSSGASGCFECFGLRRTPGVLPLAPPMNLALQAEQKKGSWNSQTFKILKFLKGVWGSFFQEVPPSFPQIFTKGVSP